MSVVEQVSIPTPGGGYLDADHYQSTNDDLAGSAGRPCVVMAHGVGGTRDCGLAGFAEVLSAAGADVIAFDYRHFAASSGSPKQVVNLPGQLADYHSAVAFARSLPGVDPARIVVWGVSLSGGHVLNVAAADPEIAAVISLTAAVDGLAAVAQMLKANGAAHVTRLIGSGLADVVSAVRRRPPVLAPVVGRPGEVAALCSPSAVDGMRNIAGPSWRNAIAARIFLRIGAYRPITAAGKISCPVLMQIADGDQSAPPSAATAAAHRLRATVHHYPCDHFDVYPGASHHDRVAAHQVAFLRRVLAPHSQAVHA
ncbi:alpha/beta hydrolase [Mycobacterium sp. GA-2829]|uniref:alpha/beta hydrolase n=1 Tax=Mycobacterium sp. GA-2829 TaxID=1772283 RepID=UPI00073FE4C7|nr:alpha/beta hydrolase [Mycobacterium sp. GA-2829]KUI34240.1 alpha/beta hydrolase [Mycobacterium sp. GA-2829]